MSKAKHRDAQIVIIIGKNGTGKSTFCDRLIKAMKRRALVLSYMGASAAWRSYPIIDLRKKTDIEAFGGIQHAMYAQYDTYRQGRANPDNAALQHIFDHFRNGILVFDDCRDYLNANADTQKYFRRLLTHFRHHMIDLFIVAHSPQEIPPVVWRYNYTIWIGATDDMIDKNRIRTFSADRILSIQKKVNEQFRQAFIRADGSHYGIFKYVIP